MTEPPCSRLRSGEPPLDRYSEICSAFAHCLLSKRAGKDRAEPDSLISRIMREARDVQGDAVQSEVDAPFARRLGAVTSSFSPVSRFSIPHEAGSGSRSASLFCEKAERLIDEGVGVLEDAAMARIREDAELRIGKGFE